MSIANHVKNPRVWIPGLMILSTLLVHFPFWFKDYTVLYRHWDGPFYLYLAKTFYVIPPDHPFQNVPTSFYAAFLPGYSFLIRIMTLFTLGHYPEAMLLATLVSSSVAAVLFHNLLKEWKLVVSPAWTTVFFCFLPPRWLLVHSIGASEPLLLCFVFGALLAFHRNSNWLVFLCIFMASITRPPGFLLVPVFMFLYWRKRNTKWLMLTPLCLLSLVCLFSWYQFVYGDFLAFFYLHLHKAYNAVQAKAFSETPFAIYRFYADHSNFHSTNYYALLYLIHLAGILRLWKRKELFVYGSVFYLFTSFQFTFDLPRYLIPVMPFSLLVAFDEILSRKSFRYIVFPLSLLFALWYAWGFAPQAGCTPEAFQAIVARTRLP